MEIQTESSPPAQAGGGPGEHPGSNRRLFDLIAWAGRDPGLSPPNKAVFLAVVAHADGDGICKQTDEGLATSSHTSVPTVQRALRLFETYRVIERAYYPPKGREIRLIPGEQSLVVVDSITQSYVQRREQHHTKARDCSPVSIPIPSEPPRPDGEADRLVALLVAGKVTEKVARELVRDFPERIIPQVEAHRCRNVRDPAASLVVAIRDNWPTEPPQRRHAAEEDRKAREAERQAELHALAAENARRKAEDEQVKNYWDGLSATEKEALDEQAIEASPARDLIRSLAPDSPIFRGYRATVRWEHVRRKLGLPTSASSDVEPL